MRSKGIVFVSLITTLVIGLLISGCAPAAPTPTPPIKIGMVNPLSGVYAKPGGDINRAVTLAFDQVGFKVAGREIKLIAEDDGAKPDIALTKTKKLVERDGVHIIVGSYHSGCSLAMRDYTDANKIPQIIAGGGVVLALSAEKRSDYVYRCSSVAGQWLPGLAEYCYNELGYRSMVIMVPDYAYGHDCQKAFKAYFETLGGKIVQEMRIAFGTLDYAPFLAKIDTTADAVYAEFAGADAIRLVKQYKEYEMWKHLALIGAHICMDEMLLEEGDAALDIIHVEIWTAAAPVSASKTFVEAYTEKWGEPPGCLAGIGYNGGLAIIQALKAINGDIEDVPSFLKALSEVSFEGSRGPFRFEPVTNNSITGYYLCKNVKKDDVVQAVVIKSFETIPASEIIKVLAAK